MQQQEWAVLCLWNAGQSRRKKKKDNVLNKPQLNELNERSHSDNPE